MQKAHTVYGLHLFKVGHIWRSRATKAQNELKAEQMTHDIKHDADIHNDVTRIIVQAKALRNAYIAAQAAKMRTKIGGFFHRKPIHAATA